MRLACVADLHGHLPAVPPCDLLLLGGDLCPHEDHTVDHQARWLAGAFRDWLEEAPAAHVVGIAGNHDHVLQRAPERVPAGLRWTLLEDRATTVAGLTVFGSPWTPWFFDWSFNAPEGPEGERFLAERYGRAPRDADVLLVHGPPRGFGDRTAGGHHVGSSAFLELIEEREPPLAVFGHIHEGRGADQHGPTQLLNVAAVDAEYRLVDEPVVVVEL